MLVLANVAGYLNCSYDDKVHLGKSQGEAAAMSAFDTQMTKEKWL